MPMTPEEAKDDSIAQLRRMKRALNKALDILDTVGLEATANEAATINKLSAAIEEHVELATQFITLQKAASVTVQPPTDDAYEELDAALGELQRLEVNSAAVVRVLQIVEAVADAFASTSSEISTRSTT